MTIISPTTQNVVSSVFAQNTALSAANNTVAPVTVNNAVAVPVDTAHTSSVSDKAIGASGYYSASLDLAALNSQLQIAQRGTGQISSLLQNLQSIAEQLANGTGDTSSLQAEFQSLYSQINQIVADTSFGGTSLLDGSFGSGSNAVGVVQGSDQSSSPSIIPNLTTQGLFGGNIPDVTTQQGAANAVTSIGNAEDVVNTASNNIDTLSKQTNFVMASLETAQNNTYASGAILSESDLGNASAVNFASKLLQEPASSVNAQTGNISGSTLTLLISGQ